MLKSLKVRLPVISDSALFVVFLLVKSLLYHHHHHYHHVLFKTVEPIAYMQSY